MNWLQNVFSGRDLTNQGCFNENSGGGGGIGTSKSVRYYED